MPAVLRLRVDLQLVQLPDFGLIEIGVLTRDGRREADNPSVLYRYQNAAPSLRRPLDSCMPSLRHTDRVDGAQQGLGDFERLAAPGTSLQFRDPAGFAWPGEPHRLAGGVLARGPLKRPPRYAMVVNAGCDLDHTRRSLGLRPVSRIIKGEVRDYLIPRAGTHGLPSCPGRDTNASFWDRGIAFRPWRQQFETSPASRRQRSASDPLGGLGDIGRNMTVLEYGGRLLLIDCGVLFPEDDHPGVDLILPGLDAIMDRLADVVALVLTHGHEDHIGAVPYLLRQRADIPLVGSKLTLALVQEKIREHRIRGTDQREVTDLQRMRFGAFDVEFLAVNHSIPDSLAVMVRTPGGTILHTGDFKMDQLPLDNRITDLRSFARVGRKAWICSWSTRPTRRCPDSRRRNATSPRLGPGFARSRQRIIVACFASHVHRVQQIMDAAVTHGRKVVYVGRSMVRNMAVARDLGYLRVPGDTLIDLRDIENHPPEDVVIISTGSQGEPLPRCPGWPTAITR